MNLRGHAGYEFDSCISTEEAFFAAEELRAGHERFRKEEIVTANGSNP